MQNRTTSTTIELLLLVRHEGKQMGKFVSRDEDIAIQDTLELDEQERLKLIAALIVDKITNELNGNYSLLKSIVRKTDD